MLIIHISKSFRKYYLRCWKDYRIIKAAGRLMGDNKVALKRKQSEVEERLENFFAKYKREMTDYNNWNGGCICYDSGNPMKGQPKCSTLTWEQIKNRYGKVTFTIKPKNRLGEKVSSIEREMKVLLREYNDGMKDWVISLFAFLGLVLILILIILFIIF